MTAAGSFGFGADSANVAVQTPRELVTLLAEEFHFDFDPCPLNPTFDGLSLLVPWGDRNFVNPPYSACAQWLERAAYEAQVHGALSVCLVPFRPNTAYWQRWVWEAATEIRVMTQRLTFEGYAPWPSTGAEERFRPKTGSPPVFQSADIAEKRHSRWLW